MDNIAFRPEIRQQIILAAFTAAGAGADDTQVAAQIERIADAMMPGSAASSTLNEFEHYWSDVVTEVNKPFQATLLYIDLETTSQRPVLALRSAPNSKNPDGKFELIKLDMARGRHTARVLAQASSYARMLGHQVSVVRMNESTSDGRKASVLRSAVSQGLAPDFHMLQITDETTKAEREQKLTEGARMVDWNSLSDSERKVASKLMHLSRRLGQQTPVPPAPPLQGQYLQGGQPQQQPQAAGMQAPWQR